MRTSLCVIAALSSVVVAGLAAAAGCGSLPDDCAALLTCPTSSSGTGGSIPMTPDECIPSKNPDSPVGDACGIFVSSGEKGSDAANLGSKEAPFKTLAAALSKAKSQGIRPVYACAEVFTESVTIDGQIELYGGLDCSKDWSYIGHLTKTTLTAAPDTVPLTLTRQTREAKVIDFVIAAKDAMSGGKSSIAVIADQAEASFERCELTAGSGAAGLPGATPADDAWPTDSKHTDIIGNDGKAACPVGATSPTLGGDQKQNMYCLGDSIGGNGGAGDIGQGSQGGANPTADPRTALGGVGQASTDTTLKCTVDATVDPKGGRGTNGNPGLPGADGDGAKDDALGTIDASGYTGPPGKDGVSGQAGQGGGGGGGAKGRTTPTSCFGASGGSGGVGGCGGPGGKGGSGGGSSIGIISLNAPLTFNMVTIKVGQGGIGGDGGEGAAGMVGGIGGRGGAGGTLQDGCPGGDGGKGGAGGRGGGGRGGHSIGIAYASATEQEMPGAEITTGTPGAGGKGLDATKDGAPGAQIARQRF